MKKIIKNLTVLIIITLVTASFSACGTSENENYFQEEYTADLNSYFVLPYNKIDGEQLSYHVTDSSGSEVELYGNGFKASDEKGYHFSVNVKGKSYQSQVNIADLSKPEIITDYDYRYILKGAKFTLPDIKCYDNSGANPEIKLILKHGDQNTDISSEKEFTPEETGEYELEITASDSAGNSAVKNILYKSTENSEEVKKILMYGEDYGLQQADDFISINISHRSDFGYGGESGSMRLIFDGTNVNPQFTIKNPIVKDWTNYSEMYFYVYNDTGDELSCFFNYAQYLYLPKGQWTKVTVKNLGTLGTSSSNALCKQDFTVNDVNGLILMFFAIPDKAFSGNLYLSSFYLSA